MKFCYIDESGTGNEPVAIMVGILVDAYRMKPTKKEWQKKFNYLTDELNLNIEEIHAKDLFKNKKAWRIISGQQKTDFVNEIIEWFIERDHEVIYSCVLKDRYDDESRTDTRLTEIGSLWRFLATHIILAIQKSMQSKKKNKGNSVLIFDNKETDKNQFTDIIRCTPTWTYSYYKKKKRQDPIDQIIDVPHFVDSKHVGLIQLADLFAYILRRDIEIKEDLVAESFDGEANSMNNWANKIKSISISKNCIYPKRSICDAARLINSLAPDSIK